MNMDYLIFFPSLFIIFLGCGRQAVSTVAPPTDNNSVPSENNNIPTDTTPAITPSQSHRKTCSQEEEIHTKCLHDGTCFAVIVGDERIPACHCANGYTGTRCQEKLIIIDFPASEGMATTTTIAIIIILTIVTALLVLAVFIFVRYQKKKHGRHHMDLGNAENGKDESVALNTTGATENTEGNTETGNLRQNEYITDKVASV